MLLALVLLAAAPNPQVEAAKKQMRALEKKYAIDIQWEFAFIEETPDSTVSTRVPKPEDLVAFAPILEKQMALFPDTLWKAEKVATIVLAKQCLRNGVSWGGFAVHSRKALLLDITKSKGKEWVRETFHHELYHLLDSIEDDAWAKLNVEKFAYRPINKPLKRWKESDDREGFASAYARTDPGEDRAETFANMIAKPKETASKAKTDDVMRAKVGAIREATAVYGLDEAWWKKRGL